MSWEYIAGFFDGEGSISHNGKGFRITIPQTNRDVLKRIHDFIGFGFIIEITKRKAHWKDSWVYYIARQREAFFFLEKIYPFLIVKRKGAANTLPKLKEVIRLQDERAERHKLRRERALRLREKGLSYRRIEKEMNLDRGYLRRIILRKYS